MNEIKDNMEGFLEVAKTINEAAGIPSRQPADYKMASITTTSIEEIRSMRQKVMDLMKSVMIEGKHYGVIPGTDKPTLLKAGAELLVSMFQLAPKPQENIRQLGNDHREYSLRVDLYHRGTGMFLGSGIGSASTKESKWNTRWGSTGEPVPGKYWKGRDVALLGGPGHMAKKDKSGSWTIHVKGENENPADMWNTVLKMSKKRALVDGVLMITACSDIFTQDMEDVIDVDEAPPVKNGSEREAPPEEQSSPAPLPSISGKPKAEKPKDPLGDVFKKLVDNADLMGLVKNLLGPQDKLFKTISEYHQKVHVFLVEEFGGCTPDAATWIKSNPADFVKRFCAFVTPADEAEELEDLKV